MLDDPRNYIRSSSAYNCDLQLGKLLQLGEITVAWAQYGEVKVRLDLSSTYARASSVDHIVEQGNNFASAIDKLQNTLMQEVQATKIVIDAILSV